MYEIYRIMPNDTDLTVFKEAGYPALNFAFIRDGQYYHTAGDTFEHLDPRSVQHHGENALAVTRRLAAMDLVDPPEGNALYTDLLGAGVLWWPEHWTLPFVALVGAVLALSWWRLARARAVRPAAPVLGLLTALLTIVLAVALGMGLVTVIQALSGPGGPRQTPPLPTRAALWAGTLLCAIVIGPVLGRRAGVWGTALGVWVLWWLLGLALSLILTGAAVVVLVPTMWAAIVIAVAAFTGAFRGAVWRDASILVAALPAACMWLQLALRFEAAVGFELSPAITFSVALAASTVGSGFALRWARGSKWLTILALATVAVACGVAVLAG
jgi:hypothetical protein